MASDIELSIDQARRLQLAAQGLLSPPRRRARRSDIPALLRTLGLLQIDTIHVVARSPYLVLHSRLGAYPAPWLDESLAAGEIGECWAHEACFVPAEHLPLHRRHMDERAGHWAHRMAQRIAATDAQGLDAVEAQIAAVGACRSADFGERGPGAGGWWGWKDEKRWLEALFHLGRLMVARRQSFQRVYDLPERVLRDPALLQAWRSPPPADQVRAHFIEHSLRALGLARAEWLADYYRLQPKVDVAELRQTLGAELLQVRVKGLEGPFYVHRDHDTLLQRAAAGRLQARHCCLLSPFDPLVWDRRRCSELFGFDYRLECYLPAEKRSHGYFVLPLLQGGRLIGRVDAKAHRADRVMEIKRLHLEQARAPSERQLREVAAALQGFADWHGTPSLSFTRIDQPQWRERLPALLRTAQAAR